MPVRWRFINACQKKSFSVRMLNFRNLASRMSLLSNATILRGVACTKMKIHAKEHTPFFHDGGLLATHSYCLPRKEFSYPAPRMTLLSHATGSRGVAYTKLKICYARRYTGTDSWRQLYMTSTFSLIQEKLKVSQHTKNCFHFCMPKKRFSQASLLHCISAEDLLPQKSIEGVGTRAKHI